MEMRNVGAGGDGVGGTGGGAGTEQSVSAGLISGLNMDFIKIIWLVSIEAATASGCSAYFLVFLHELQEIVCDKLNKHHSYSWSILEVGAKFPYGQPASFLFFLLPNTP